MNEHSGAGGAIRGRVALLPDGEWRHTRAGLRGFALWCLARLPLTVGICVRARLMPHFLQRMGEGTIFHTGFVITDPNQVSIGSNCAFGRGVFIKGGGGVTIGDWVGFGPDVKILSMMPRFDDPDRPWQLQGWEYQPVVIEDDVWLGANVFVMPGVRIGRGAVVSAVSVVTNSVPANAVIAGNPGRVVAWRNHMAESAGAHDPGVVAGRDGASPMKPETRP